MKKVLCCFMGSLLLVCLAVGYGAAAPIELKCISIYPEIHQSFQCFVMLRDRVNQRAKGELVIKHIGGPEAMGPFDQPKAVAKGVIDMAITFSGSYAGLVPGENLFSVSQIPFDKERELGFYDLMNEIHNKAGLFFLGRGAAGYGHKEPRKWHLWVNKKIKRPQDLAGMKIGAISPAMNNFARALGVAPVVVTATDLHTALERGVVDGQFNPMGSFLALGGMEVCKYYIDLTYATDNNVFIINLATWNRLPKHLQKLMTEVAIEVERDYPPIEVEFVKKCWEKMRSAGIEFIQFSPTDKDWFINLFYQAEWKALLEKYPEVASRAKKMLVR